MIRDRAITGAPLLAASAWILGFVAALEVALAQLAS